VNMGAELRDIVLNGTKVKMVGRSQDADRRSSAAVVGIDPSHMHQMKIGDFFTRTAAGVPFKLHTGTHLLDHTNSMPEAAWQLVRRRQLAAYYRPLDADVSPPPPITEAPVVAAPEPSQEQPKQPPVPKGRRRREFI
jgi:hypothetical protein